MPWTLSVRPASVKGLDIKTKEKKPKPELRKMWGSGFSKDLLTLCLFESYAL